MRICAYVQQAVQLSVSLQTVSEQKKQLEDDLQRSRNMVRTAVIFIFSILLLLLRPIFTFCISVKMFYFLDYNFIFRVVRVLTFLIFLYLM